MWILFLLQRYCIDITFKVSYMFIRKLSYIITNITSMTSYYNTIYICLYRSILHNGQTQSHVFNVYFIQAKWWWTIDRKRHAQIKLLVLFCSSSVIRSYSARGYGRNPHDSIFQSSYCNQQFMRRVEPSNANGAWLLKVTRSKLTFESVFSQTHTELQTPRHLWN